MAEKKTGTHGREALAKILARTPEPEGLVTLGPDSLAGDFSFKEPDSTAESMTVQEVAEVQELQESINRIGDAYTEKMKAAIANGEENDPSLADRVGMALDTIRKAIDSGFKFTDAQKDVGIDMSLPCITETEREWFLEVAEKILVVPRWQCLWGQFRRCHEWGLANAPLLDPGWETGEMGPLELRECEWCHQMYQPKDRKARFCSNKCGGAEERQRLGIRDEPKKVAVEDGEPEYLEDLLDQAKKTTTSAMPSLPDLPLGPMVKETIPEA